MSDTVQGMVLDRMRRGQLTAPKCPICGENSWEEIDPQELCTHIKCYSCGLLLKFVKEAYVPAVSVRGCQPVQP